MTLTLDQEEKLRFMLADLGDNLEALTTWERNFVQDHIKRYDELGANMFMSGKQWACLTKIYEKNSDVN